MGDDALAITILETVGESEAGVRARIRHGDTELIAVVAGDVEAALRSAGPVLVELEYGRITACSTLDGFDDEAAGIWQGPGDSAVVRGRVTQVVEDQGQVFVDLYLMKGPEFFLFRTEDAAIPVPDVDAGIEVVVEGLRFLLPSS